MEPIQLFLHHCELQGLSPRTIKGIQSALKFLLRSFPDPFKLSGKDAVSFFLKGKANGFASSKPAGPSNYNNIRNYLNKFYSWAVTNDYMKSNPIKNVPRCKYAKRLPRRLSQEQAGRLLYHAFNFPHPSKYLRVRNYAIIATLLITGLRAQELLDLRLEDICIERSTIRVRCGKRQRERVVFFNDDLRIILKDYLVERTRLKKESILFFVSYRSNKRIQYKDLHRMIHRIGQRTNFYFTAHQLRHTCFSLLAEQGVDIPTIQAQAGHSSIATTQIYLSISERHRREAIRKVRIV